MPDKPSLGLYFNDNFIELSQVSSDGQRLERYNQLILPQGLVINSEIKDSGGFALVLRQLFSTAKPGPVSLNGNVVLGVNDNRVFLSEFTVPNVLGKNLNEAIDYRVRSSLSMLPSGVQTDWEIIGKSKDGLIEVLLAAIPRTIIDTCVAICSSVGLRVVAVEPAVCANIRIIEQVQLLGKDQLLVYLGENFGVFSYITSGNPRFSDFLAQAEIDKAGDVSRTIESYINFANAKHPNRLVSEVIVSGSKQSIDRVVIDLKEKKIAAVKAISRLAKTEVQNHTLLHTSHGLCLHSFDLQPTLNLLPIEFRLEGIKGRLFRSWKYLVNGLIVLSVLGLGALYYLNQQALSRQIRLRILTDRYSEQLKLPESQSLFRQVDKLNQITGQLVTLRETTGSEENILKKLTANTPTGIILTSFAVSRNPVSGKLSDAGSSWVITGSAISRDLVLGFYNSLLTSSGFSDGKLYFGSLEKDTGITFRIANVPTK